MNTIINSAQQGSPYRIRLEHYTPALAIRPAEPSLKSNVYLFSIHVETGGGFFLIFLFVLATGDSPRAKQSNNKEKKNS